MSYQMCCFVCRLGLLVRVVAVVVVVVVVAVVVATLAMDHQVQTVVE